MPTHDLKQSHSATKPGRGSGRRAIAIAVVSGILVSFVILLLLSAVVIWRVSLSSSINARLDAIKKAGQPTHPSDLQKWFGSVPTNENAVVLYRQAIAVLKNDNTADRDMQVQLDKLAKNAALPPELQAQFVKCIKENQECLKLLHAASALKKCRYDIDFSQGFNTPLAHLGKIKVMSFLLQKQALISAQTGNLDQSTDAIVDMFALGRSLSFEPCLLALLVEATVYAKAETTLEKVFNQAQLNERQLNKFIDQLPTDDKREEFLKALVTERTLILPIFRMSPSELANLSPEEGQEPQRPIPGAGSFVRATGFFERDLLFWLDSMETNIALAKLPPPDNLVLSKEIDAQADRARRKYYIFSGLMLPTLGNSAHKCNESVARTRLMQTALAIEKYRLAHQGGLPAGLAALTPDLLKEVPIDPFDSQPLRYKRLEKGYVVYSVGSDRKDDGGLERVISRKSDASTPYDVTFKVLR